MIEEKENQFFNRKDVKLLVKHDKSATPSKAELTKKLAEQNSVDESQIVIDFIATKKGEAESLVKLKILKEKPPKPAEEAKEKKEGEKKKEPQPESKQETKEEEKVEAQADQGT